MNKRFIVLVLVLSVALTAACGAVLGARAYTINSPEPTKVRVVRAEDSADGYTTIYKLQGEDLKILDFTDPQIKPYLSDYVEKFGGSNENTFVFLERFVVAVKPDLVTITGDLVHSLAFGNAGFFKEYCEMFERLGVYWAPTFGNHDCEAEFVVDSDKLDNVIGQPKKETLIGYLSSFEHCLIEVGDAGEGGGAGNYFINVRDESTEELVYTLCMMDCVSNMENKTYFRKKMPAQVAWYERHIRELSDAEYGADRAPEQVVKSMIFTHVAPPEAYTAFEIAWNDGNPTSDYCYGRLLENGSSSKDYHTCTLFSKVRELGSTTAIFFGHQHNNDFHVKYEGVDLVFGQHSGLAHYYRMDVWDGYNVDMSDIFRYGDERGAVEIKIKSSEQYAIERKLAVDTIQYDDIRIDYEALAEKLISEGYNVTGYREEMSDAA